MTNKEHADRLTRALCAAYPGLKRARIAELWGVVCSMKRGEIIDREWCTWAWEKSDWIVATHLARELDYHHQETAAKQVQRLSAHAKRKAFPRSYEEEKEK